MKSNYTAWSHFGVDFDIVQKGLLRAETDARPRPQQIEISDPGVVAALDIIEFVKHVEAIVHGRFGKGVYMWGNCGPAKSFEKSEYRNCAVCL